VAPKVHKMSLALPLVVVEDIRTLAALHGRSAAEVTRQAIVLGLSALRVPGPHTPEKKAREKNC